MARDRARPPRALPACAVLGPEVELSVARILFCELLGGLGDVVIALPAIHGLARSHRDAQLTVLTFAPGSALLDADPAVASVVVPAEGESAARAVRRVLACERWDVVISDVTYDGIDRLVSESAAAVRVANLWRSPPDHELIERRFVRLLIADGLIAPQYATLAPAVALRPDERQWARAWLADALPGPDPRVLLLADSGMAIKRWPSEHWVALARRLAREHGARPVLLGGGDSHRARAVTACLPDAATLPPVGLRHAAALAAEVDACVGVDTGLTRIAAACATPTVGLFGPTWAGRFGLYGGHANIQSPVVCAVRDPRDMTAQRCWYSGRCVFDDRSSCLDDISVASVTALLAGHLGRRAEATG